MSVIQRLAHFFWTQTRISRRLRHRRSYPGLRIDDTATVSGAGALVWGREAAVGPDSVLMIGAGATLELGEMSYVGRYVELAPERSICIGRSTSIQDRCVILGDVSIGANSTLAYNVYISSGRHVFDWSPALPIKTQDAQAPKTAYGSRPVVVEEDCWLGNNVVVMGGVRIGKGAVVGANCVVTKNVAPYSVVGGVPARLLKTRMLFVPPRAITFERDECLPYFYAGFSVLHNDRLEAMSAGGLWAGKHFSLALSARVGDVLRVTMRGEAGDLGNVNYFGQQAVLTDTFCTYDFSVESDEGNHEFTLENCSKIRVASAYVA